MKKLILIAAILMPTQSVAAEPNYAAIEIFSNILGSAIAAEKSCDRVKINADAFVEMSLRMKLTEKEEDLAQAAATATAKKILDHVKKVGTNNFCPTEIRVLTWAPKGQIPPLSVVGQE